MGLVLMDWHSAAVSSNHSAASSRTHRPSQKACPYASNNKTRCNYLLDLSATGAEHPFHTAELLYDMMQAVPGVLPPLRNRIHMDDKPPSHFSLVVTADSRSFTSSGKWNPCSPTGTTRAFSTIMDSNGAFPLCESTRCTRMTAGTNSPFLFR